VRHLFLLLIIFLSIPTMSDTLQVASPDPEIEAYEQAMILQKKQQDSIARYEDSLEALPKVVIAEVMPVPIEVTISSSTFDSLQCLIDSAMQTLARNKHYKQMLDYSMKDKINYLRFLIRSKMETRESVQNALGTLIFMAQLEENQIALEFEKHQGMEKAILFRNIKKRQGYKQKLMDFQFQFLEKEQVKPQCRGKDNL
jgi:hypothetical protein